MLKKTIAFYLTVGIFTVASSMDLQSQLKIAQEKARTAPVRERGQWKREVERLQGEIESQSAQPTRPAQPPVQPTGLRPIAQSAYNAMKEAYEGQFANGQKIGADELTNRLLFFQNKLKGQFDISSLPKDFERKVNFLIQQAKRLSSGPQIAPPPAQPLPERPTEQSVEDLTRAAAEALNRVLSIGNENVNRVLIDVASNY